MKKKLITVLTAVAVTATSLLGGCGLFPSVPTAEKLVENAFNKEGTPTKTDMTMTMEASIPYDGQDLDATVIVDMTVKATNEVSYADGDVDVDIAGTKVRQNVKAWSEVKGNKLNTYTYDEASDKWLSDSTTLSKDTVINGIGVKAEDFEDLELQKADSGSNEITVTGTLGYDSLGEIFGDDFDINEMFGDTGLDLNDFKFDATMKFDKKTKELVKMNMVYDVDALNKNSADVEFKEVVLDMQIEQLDKDFELKVPSDVVSEAVDKLDAQQDELNEQMQGVEEATKELEENMNNTDSSDTEGADTQGSQSSAATTAGNNDWTTFTTVMGSTSITLPCSYRDLKAATGLTMTQSEEDSYLENNHYTTVSLKDDAGTTVFSADITNTTGSDISQADGTVTKLVQRQVNVSKLSNDEIAVYAGGITAGMKLDPDTLLGMFGEPTDKKEYGDGDYYSNRYRWCKDASWKTANYFEVTITNGEVEQVMIDHSEE